MKSQHDINKLLSSLPSAAAVSAEDRAAIQEHLQALLAPTVPPPPPPATASPMPPAVASGIPSVHPSQTIQTAIQPGQPSPKAATEPPTKKVKVEPSPDVLRGATAAACLGKSPEEKAALKKENDKAWGKFNRSLLPAPEKRVSHVARCPPHLADRIRSSGPKDVLEWFQVHREVNGDWADVEIKMRLRETQRKAEQFGDKYETRTEMLKTHGYEENLPDDKKAMIISLVDRIILEKEKKSLWIPHPDLPDEPTLRLYKVFDFKTETNARECEASKEAELKTNLGSAAYASLSHLLPSGPSLSSSSSSTPAIAQSEVSLREELDKAKQTAADYQAKEDAKKAEIEAKKNKREAEREKPFAKAKKESGCCTKEIQNLEREMADVQGSNVPDELKREWKKKMNADIKVLKILVTKLDKCPDEEKAVELVTEAPELIQAGADVRKNWRRVKRALDQ